MGNQIRPLARLFRAMADLIDRDHASQTRYAAIAKAAGMVAARATAEDLDRHLPLQHPVAGQISSGHPASPHQRRALGRHQQPVPRSGLVTRCRRRA